MKELQQRLESGEGCKYHPLLSPLPLPPPRPSRRSPRHSPREAACDLWPGSWWYLPNYRDSQWHTILTITTRNTPVIRQNKKTSSGSSLNKLTHQWQEFKEDLKIFFYLLFVLRTIVISYCWEVEIATVNISWHIFMKAWGLVLYHCVITSFFPPHFSIVWIHSCWRKFTKENKPVIFLVVLFCFVMTSAWS